MVSVSCVEGELRIDNVRFGVLATRFNSFIVDHLITGALNTLRRHGVEDNLIEVVRVPGAFELPLVAKTMARRGSYDALIALGCVIRGATPHFEFIAGECARGLSRVAFEFDIPVAFGVLTTDTLEQAIERAGSKAGNKGVDAACTALEMVSLLRGLSS
ncbi:MAG TPA: 6,7-dimethyl-8-ribityllumazine synthase [Gammaproteobacteria bacterium]|nr:6,7-dimethyl-8-ribityllumazine synthase [Gammaproteobacteria bacterium]